MSHMQEIIRLLKANTGAKRLVDVFSDFVHIGAIAYRNSVDKHDWQSREDQYLRTVGQYSKDQVNRFVEVLALFTQEMEREPRDVLGELYMSLELGSKDLGQCFTPWQVAQLMAEIADSKIVDEAIADIGYAQILEPACGAGAMALATVERLRKLGYNPQRQVHLIAEDINSTAVHMAYMQLSILGIPAVVYQRDTLTRETYSTWPTPMHVLGNWNQRLQENNTGSETVLQKA